MSNIGGEGQDAKASLSRQINGAKDDSVAVATTSVIYVDQQDGGNISQGRNSVVAGMRHAHKTCPRAVEGQGPDQGYAEKGNRIVMRVQYAARDRRCGAFKDIENQSLYAI